MSKRDLLVVIKMTIMPGSSMNRQNLVEPLKWLGFLKVCRFLILKMICVTAYYFTMYKTNVPAVLRLLDSSFFRKMLRASRVLDIQSSGDILSDLILHVILSIFPS